MAVNGGQSTRTKDEEPEPSGGSYFRDEGDTHTPAGVVQEEEFASFSRAELYKLMACQPATASFPPKRVTVSATRLRGKMFRDGGHKVRSVGSVGCCLSPAQGRRGRRLVANVHNFPLLRQYAATGGVGGAAIAGLPKAPRSPAKRRQPQAHRRVVGLGIGSLQKSGAVAAAAAPE